MTTANQKKVSFDFDGTLHIPEVLNYAKSLVEKGYEVWIVTQRTPDNELIAWNGDLFETAKEIGITEDHIKFVPDHNKYVFLKGKGFLWHLDDYREEIDLINEHCKDCFGIWVNDDWENLCNGAISNNK